MSTIPRQMPAFLFGLPPLAKLFGGSAARRAAGGHPAARPATLTVKKPAGTWPAPAAAAPAGLDVDRLLAKAKLAPDLAPIEWDGDRTIARGAAGPGADNGAGADPFALDPRRRKIRERYVAARFPGVARTLADLESADRMIKAARLYFEEQQAELAVELLELAAQEAPHESPLWLARLEILFLLRDREGFVQTAHAFRGAHPRHDAWPEVERLGRALAPGEPLFGATTGPREHEHYGPWPHTPNWIRAPWDLTAEIAAADFHRCALRFARRSPAQKS